MTLSRMFLTADSIEIVSHQDLHLRSTPEEIERGISGYWRAIVDEDHQLNECIVMERTLLDKEAVKELMSIWMRKPDSEVPADKASCFLPHEAILFYRKGLYAYIDICFSCRRYTASPEILSEEEFLQAESDWQQLKTFFIRRGISYGMAP